MSVNDFSLFQAWVRDRVRSLAGQGVQEEVGKLMPVLDLLEEYKGKDRQVVRFMAVNTRRGVLVSFFSIEGGKMELLEEMMLEEGLVKYPLDRYSWRLLRIKGDHVTRLYQIHDIHPVELPGDVYVP